jgi:hypothetical protein
MPRPWYEYVLIVLSVKHAGIDALGQLEDLLTQLRSVETLKERSAGVFYRRSKAFLHFHEDPLGLFADLRCEDDFVRFKVNTASQQKLLMSRVRREMSRGL